MCEVVAVAKDDLEAGQTLDGMGGFLSYGVIDNVDAVRRDDLLPMGLSEGAVLVQDVPQDQPIRYEDVQIPTLGVAHQLYREQIDFFFDAEENALA